MAVCNICKREMKRADGCLPAPVILDGIPHTRIKMGAKGDLYGEPDWLHHERCGDCGAMRGGFHHCGCDIERCPACGEQLISCSCEIE